MLDSVPMVCLTGQVASSLLGTDAFQELDVFGLTMPIVKHSFLVRSIQDLPSMVQDAFRIAREGRPGPVLIDLPKDVQMTDASHLQDHVSAAVMAPPQAEAAMIIEAAAAIASAEKPVIYGGGGIALADAVNVFRTFVDTTSIPTTLTLRGLGRCHTLILITWACWACMAPARPTWQSRSAIYYLSLAPVSTTVQPGR